MRRRLALCLAVLALFPLLATPGGADEERRSSRLVTRIFQVGALTNGLQMFLRPAAPIEFTEVSDEENPLFGCPAEEPLYPYGQVDELIEIVKMNVDPAIWEQTEGADILSMGEDRLVCRAPRTAQAQIGAYLARLEREALTPHTLDIRVVALNKPKEAIAAVSLTALPKQIAVGWDGFQHAYVWDYSVEVAKSAKVSHPLVMVANVGLIARASVHPASEGGETRVRVNAVLTQLTSTDRVGVGEDREIEKPVFRSFRVNADALAEPGQWKRIDASTHVDGTRVAYEVRVTRHNLALRPTEPDHAFLDPKPYDDSGKMTTRMIDVGRLHEIAYDVQGTAEWHLTPTNFTPPEPPELREPYPLFPSEAIPDLIMSGLGDAGAWEQGYMEVRNGRLFVRNTEPVINAVEQVIKKLRRGSLRTLKIQAALIETDAMSAENLSVAGSFPTEDLKTVLSSGAAKVLWTGQLLSARDTRRALTAGDVFSYVSGYAVELAEDSTISNPIISRAFEGIELDITPRLGSTEGAVLLETRFVKTSRRENERTADTPHGRLDVPQLDTIRFQGTSFVKLGNTVVAGVAGKGGQRQVLLLTPTLTRAER